MRYGIFVNPKAGDTSVDEKRKLLDEVMEILGGDGAVYGLDTDSAEEFRALVAEKAPEVEIVIAAGGDGSVSDAINAVDGDAVFAFLPLGSACALRDALGLPDHPMEVAQRIADGRDHELDLILCDEERKAFVCAVGVEGYILQRREQLQKEGRRGLTAYAMALVSTFGKIDRTEMTLSLDHETSNVSNVATAIITKIPYYGYKMEVVPEAVFDDGLLYLRFLDKGWTRILANLAKSRFFGDRSKAPRQAREIHIKTKEKRYLHIDGNVAREGNSFRFRVLPGALHMRY